ncbi:hypothetical protein Taro_035735, partial [Colocasia esculenta]|nr:hypothetical protein [Colocasia esculenta]
MGSGGVGRTISQEAFEEMVRENMEDLGMEPAEALEDAIHALSLQGVDISGIVKCIPGVTRAKDDPVLQTLDSLKKTVAAGAPRLSTLDEMVQLVERLRDLCSSSRGGTGSENSSIAVRNGAVELLCSICSLLDVEEEHALASALKALSTVLRGSCSAARPSLPAMRSADLTRKRPLPTLHRVADLVRLPAVADLAPTPSATSPSAFAVADLGFVGSSVAALLPSPSAPGSLSQKWKGKGPSALGASPSQTLCGRADAVTSPSSAGGLLPEWQCRRPPLRTVEHE